MLGLLKLLNMIKDFVVPFVTMFIYLILSLWLLQAKGTSHTEGQGGIICKAQRVRH